MAALFYVQGVYGQAASAVPGSLQQRTSTAPLAIHII